MTKFNWHVGPYATLQNLMSVLCWQESSQTVDVCCPTVTCPTGGTQREHTCWGLHASYSPPLSCSLLHFMRQKINSQTILHLLLAWQHTHLTDVPMKFQQRKGRDIDSYNSKVSYSYKGSNKNKNNSWRWWQLSLVRHHISPRAVIDLDPDKLQPQAPAVLAQ